MLVVSLFFSRTGLTKYNRLKNEHEKLTEINRVIDQENRSLEAEVRALEESDEYIGKVARDRMGMTKPNEIIIKLRK